MDVRPLTDAPFGADVALDVPAELPTIGPQLRSLLARHHLLILNGDLTDEEHIRFISMFGRVLPQGPRVEVGALPETGCPIVTYVTNQIPGEGLGAFDLLFHHDLAHTATPLSGLSLHALDVASGQTPTRFANGVLAYRLLPEKLKLRLERLQGIFIGNYTTISDRAVSAREARTLIDPTWPHVVHPIVVSHPLTGERSLFVNEMQTTAIVGLPSNESDDLLEQLFAACYDPAIVHAHHWQTHDLVVWDNLALQHARSNVDVTAPRALRRVVFGQRTPWEEWPNTPPTASPL